MIATIGFFDGMHEGHRYVISQVTQLAEKRGDGSIVFTFDRHPASLFCPEKAPKLLLTPEEKMDKIAACGVEDVVMFEFDEELASLTKSEFLQILKEDYAVDTLLLGYDNHFGKKEKDSDGNFINPTFDDYVKKGKEEVYCWTEEQREEAAMRLGKGSDKGYNIQRYKGLGEMSEEQLWDTTMDPSKRRLRQITIDNAAEAERTFSMLMGDDVPPRRQFIEENAHYANIDA